MVDDEPRFVWLDRLDPDASGKNDGAVNPIGPAAAGDAIGADSEIGCEKPPLWPWAFLTDLEILKQ